jgi:hypothetical protein
MHNILKICSSLLSTINMVLKKSNYEKAQIQKGTFSIPFTANSKSKSSFVKYYLWILNPCTVPYMSSNVTIIFFAHLLLVNIGAHMQSNSLATVNQCTIYWMWGYRWTSTELVYGFTLVTNSVRCRSHTEVGKYIY